MSHHIRELSTEDLAQAKQRSDDGGVIERSQSVQHSRTVLFRDDEAERFKTQWGDIQAAFVDAPRQAVERADGLVAEVMKRMAEEFAGERANLEQQWDRGDEVTTEDLRVALQRYRAFFDRLLSV